MGNGVGIEEPELCPVPKGGDRSGARLGAKACRERPVMTGRCESPVIERHRRLQRGAHKAWRGCGETEQEREGEARSCAKAARRGFVHGGAATLPTLESNICSRLADG